MRASSFCSDSLQARSYFPSTARFLSVDPGRDYDLSRPQSFNLFGYVEGRPVTLVDPWGLQAYDLGVRETIEVMGEDPCPEAPPGVGCAEHRTAKEFMRRMIWESARQRAAEREDPMLAIMREVGSLSRDATPPCRSMSFGQKWAINMNDTWSRFLELVVDPSFDRGMKVAAFAAARVPVSWCLHQVEGLPTLVHWAKTGFAGAQVSGASFLAAEAGVLGITNWGAATALALPAYAVGVSLGSAYQAMTAPCATFR